MPRDIVEVIPHPDWQKTDIIEVAAAVLAASPNGAQPSL
jgi:hypothetical protein